MQTQQHYAKVLLRRMAQDPPLSIGEINSFGIGTEEEIRNFWYCHHLLCLCESPIIAADAFEQFIIDPISTHKPKKVKVSTPKLPLLTPSASTTDIAESHEPVEKRRTFVCTEDHCGRVYQTICALKYHRKTGHGRRQVKELVAYECPKCNSHFSSKRQLLLHEKADEHPGSTRNGQAERGLVQQADKVEEIDVVDYYLV